MVTYVYMNRIRKNNLEKNENRDKKKKRNKEKTNAVRRCGEIAVRCGRRRCAMLAGRAQSPAKHSAMTPQFRYQQKVKPLLGYMIINILILSRWVLDEVLLRGLGTKCRCTASGEGGRPLKYRPTGLPNSKSDGVLKHTCKLIVRMVMEKK